MFRFISIILRKIKSRKVEAKVLKQFLEWKKQLQNSNVQSPTLKLLIIRLDDIGDYILFRNFLASYKNAERWKDYSITFLGNIVWKDLFEMYDADTVNAVIWIDKKQYFADELYRHKTWMQLHSESFETVVSPSRTRQLLLDDICTIAACAKHTIGAKNNSYHTSWNKTSDDIYSELLNIDNKLMHEFYFNKAFTEWCCLTDQSGINLQLPVTYKEDNNTIICFIGASTKSKKWPEQNWIELIQLLQKEYHYKILIAGGNNDVSSASIIKYSTGVEPVAGKTSLTEMVNLIANAAVVISNDTMAAHIAVACNTSTVLLANGNNAYRFTDYADKGMQHVKSLYPKSFIKKLKYKGKSALAEYVAVTSDIATIKPLTVFDAVNNFVNNK